MGTEVTIKLPTCSPPTWFLDKFVVKIDSKIAIVDDGLTPNSYWLDRFCSYSARVSHLSYSEFKSESCPSFDLYILDQPNPTYCLMEVGKRNIGSKAIVITDLFDQKNIQSLATETGAKILPKQSIRKARISLS